MVSQCATRVYDILLVEDNPGDARLAREAFKEAHVDNRLHLVDDGEKAVRFLRRQGVFADSPRPDLILLDLNLPRKNGIEVLSDIKTDADLRRIPVVVLTSSRADEDVMGTYGLHANSFVAKPLGLDDFIRVVKSIEGFWLTFVTLPSR